MSIGGDANHVRRMYGACTEHVRTLSCNKNEEKRIKKKEKPYVFITK